MNIDKYATNKWTLFWAALAINVALCAPATSTYAATFEKRDAPLIPVLLGPPVEPSYIPEDQPNQIVPQRVTVNVTYTGFTAAAKAAFQRAINIWAGQLTSSIPITVSASYAQLPTGVLGQAGPAHIWLETRTGTIFPDAIANKRAGGQLSPDPDIVAQFSSAYKDWHFGTTPAPRGKVDFTSVVLHELGHGLGFLGAGRVSSGKGSVRIASYPFVYDRFTENGAGKAMLTFPDNSATLATQLQSNNLWFDSTLVRAANGGKRAKLFAPTTFQQGSSYSHLDETTYRLGNPNSLMTPAISPGETIRSPGPITLAIFKSTGW